jgi:hypothetical protein
MYYGILTGGTIDDVISSFPAENQPEIEFVEDYTFGRKVYRCTYAENPATEEEVRKLMVPINERGIYHGIYVIGNVVV